MSPSTNMCDDDQEAVLRIRDDPGSEYFHPGSEYFHPGSEFFPSRIPDPHQPQKIVSKLLEILSGLFIPDLDPGFLPIPYPGVKRHRIPDPQHCEEGSLSGGYCLVVSLMAYISSNGASNGYASFLSSTVETRESCTVYINHLVLKFPVVRSSCSL
jgi:hypothetical protein